MHVLVVLHSEIDGQQQQAALQTADPSRRASFRYSPITLLSS